jgi:hypothetical protein
MVTSPKSLTKSTKDDRNSEETPKASSKRKRTPDKEKVCNLDSAMIFFSRFKNKFQLACNIVLGI